MLLETVDDTTTKIPAEQLPPPAMLIQLLFGKHVSLCLSAIARLGVCDHMEGGAVEVERLSQLVGAHAPSLYRVMRTLASFDVFGELPGRRFFLKPVGDLLRSNAPESMRYSAIQMGETWSLRAMEHLTETICTGEDGITKAYGKNVFEVFAGNPAQAEVFNKSMTGYSNMVMEPIVKSYDFSRIRRMADVGGGHGALLAAVLKANSSMRGVVYDLPEVVFGGTCSAHFECCRNRVSFEAGSFFERVPANCDAYMMKFILHDWSDDHCRKILSLICEQLPADGRVLVCEQVLNTDPAPSPAKLLDIEMLAMTVGGKERTAAEFDDLFASVGLRLVQIVETGSPVCVLEARKA